MVWADARRPPTYGGLARGLPQQARTPDDPIVVAEPGRAGDQGEVVATGGVELSHLVRGQHPAAGDAVSIHHAAAVLDVDLVARLELVDVLEVGLPVERDDVV